MRRTPDTRKAFLRRLWRSYGPDGERERRIARLARLDMAAIERAAGWR